MNSLAATYDWKSSVEPADASSSPLCDCLERSPAEQEVQEFKAKAEFALLRDRTRKACASWLGEPQSRKPTAAPIRIEWKVEPADLVRQLCHWKHTSALTLIEMTPCLAELTRQHRRLEGSSPEPPASKNKLTLTVWNLAATVQAKLQQWRECVEAETEDAFNGVIVVRTCDLVPIWMWEADCLRHRPALTSVCDRMLSMQLFRYRQECDQLTQMERQQVNDDHEPLFTPFGLRWPRGASEALSSPPPPPRTTPTIRSRSKKVFAGETFCFSGAFSISREAMLELIRNNGGTIAKSVIRLCTYLVAESLGSAKTRKAQAAGIPIVTEQWVHTSMATGKKSTDLSLFVARPSRSDDDGSNASEEQPEFARPATSKCFTARLARASRRPTRVSLSGMTAVRARPSVVASRCNPAHDVRSSPHSKGNADSHRSRGVIMISTNRRYDAPHISEHLQNEDDDDDEAATASDDSEEEIDSDDSDGSEADRSSSREDTSSDGDGEEPTTDRTDRKLKSTVDARLLLPKSKAR